MGNKQLKLDVGTTNSPQIQGMNNDCNCFGYHWTARSYYIALTSNYFIRLYKDGTLDEAYSSDSMNAAIGAAYEWMDLQQVVKNIDGVLYYAFKDYDTVAGNATLTVKVRTTHDGAWTDYSDNEVEPTVPIYYIACPIDIFK